MSGLRADARKLGAGWNDTLLWYAKAILDMQKRSLEDTTSWRFLAAMHQFDRDYWIDLGIIDEATKLPPDNVRNAAWNQCQHSSYYFLPWHRGYLFAFEAIVARTVEQLGGPAGWKLPYWNYLDANNPDARKIPDAFLEKFLPDGATLNPLSQVPRYGQTELGPEPLLQIDDISLEAMNEPRFTGMVSFGGSSTAFSNPALGESGQLENNPHGSVHVLVGGAPPANSGYGYLSSFATAGLDPLFWLHHCNLDRLWEAWMTKTGVNMEGRKAWLDGPADRAFAMPKADGSGLEAFTARDTLSGGSYYSGYDDLLAGTGVVPGGAAVKIDNQGAANMAKPEVIGANPEKLAIGIASVETIVRIATQKQAALTVAMGPDEASGDGPSRLYLKLENIRGASIAGGIKAYVNAPPVADEDLSQDYVAGSAALFGLQTASAPDGAHGGNGITLVFDITALAQRLVASGDFDQDNLRIRIITAHDGGDEAPVTIDRVSLVQE